MYKIFVKAQRRKKNAYRLQESWEPTLRKTFKEAHCTKKNCWRVVTQQMNDVYWAPITIYYMKICNSHHYAKEHEILFLAIYLRR